MLTEQTKNYNITNREITLGTGNKRIGMYLGEQYNPACKECKNILITSAASNNFRDTILITTKELYKNTFCSAPSQISDCSLSFINLVLICSLKCVWVMSK